MSIATWPLLPDTTSPTTDPVAASAARVAAPPAVGASAARGIVLPFQRDAKSDFANVAGVDLIRSNIRQILSTRAGDGRSAGDVAWDSSLGSQLPNLSHRNGTTGLDEIIRHYVADAVRAQEPRARVTRAAVTRRGKASFVDIRFVPTDLNGRAIGEESGTSVPLGR